MVDGGRSASRRRRRSRCREAISVSVQRVTGGSCRSGGGSGGSGGGSGGSGGGGTWLRRQQVALLLVAAVILQVVERAQCYYPAADGVSAYLGPRDADKEEAAAVSISTLNDLLWRLYSPNELVEGDIRLPRTFWKRNAINDASKQWPGAVVPYSISDQFSYQTLVAIQEAFTAISAVSCVSFVDYDPTVHTNYVRIEQWDDCSSSIGMEAGGGAQYVSLGAACQQPGQIVHEMLHTLGFWHEHSRMDRDQYIDVNFPNIIPKQRNFAMYPQPLATLLGEPYDYGSIMHYGAYEYALDPGVPTIVTTRDPSAMSLIGQREALSDVDVRKINTYYNCNVRQTRRRRSKRRGRGGGAGERNRGVVRRLWSRILSSARRRVLRRSSYSKRMDLPRVIHE